MAQELWLPEEPDCEAGRKGAGGAWRRGERGPTAGGGGKGQGEEGEGVTMRFCQILCRVRRVLCMNERSLKRDNGFHVPKER